MSLVGPDGKPIDISKAKVIGEEEHSWEAGGLRITWGDTPEKALQRSLKGAQQMVGQAAGQAALERTGSHSVAQQDAIQAAGSVQNPFQIEPAAAAVFMLLGREIAYRDSLIEFLCSKMEIDPDDLPNKPWPDPKEAEEVEDEKEEFDNAVEDMSTSTGSQEQH